MPEDTLNDLKEGERTQSKTKEAEEGLKKREELLQEQYPRITAQLNEADQKGVICGEDDKKKVFDWLEALTPESLSQASQLLQEHLKKKERHLKKYQEEVQKAEEEKNISPQEAEKLLEEYKGKTGAERKKTQEELPKTLKTKEQEHQSFDELLESSPHFSIQGKLTQHAEKLHEAYHKADEKERKTMKKKLIEEINHLDAHEEECKSLFHQASNFYQEGEFEDGEDILEVIIGICDEHPESPRLATIREWNERDLINLQDHTRKKREIQKLTHLRESFTRMRSFERAIDVGQDLAKKTRDFYQFTVNHKGEKVNREHKYQTPYLANLQRGAEDKLNDLLTMKKERQREEQGEETLEKDFVKDMVHTKEGDRFGVEMAAIGEQLQKTKEKREEKASQNQKGTTEERLSEGGQEVAIDLKKENTGIADKLKQREVKTQVVREGRKLNQQEELEREVDKKTLQFIHRYLGKKKKEGVSEEAIGGLHETAHHMAETKHFGKTLTHEVRTQPEQKMITLGDHFERRKRQAFERLAGHVAGHVEEEKEKNPETIVNLADQVRQKRQKVKAEA